MYTYQKYKLESEEKEKIKQRQARFLNGVQTLSNHFKTRDEGLLIKEY